MIHYLRTKVTFRILYIISFLLLVFCDLKAQDQAIDRLSQDTATELSSRSFPSATLDAYKSENAFQYASSPKENLSYWDRFKRWFYQRFIRPLLNDDGFNIMGILIRVLAVFAVGALIYFIVKNRRKSELEKRDVTWGDVFVNPTEVTDEQYLEWMSKAENEGDFNLAIKWLYLFVIKQMDRKEYLRYRPEYTNRQVLGRIKDEQIRSIFQQVAHHFEYVMYGHFSIETSEYQDLKHIVFESPLRV